MRTFSLTKEFDISIDRSKRSYKKIPEFHKQDREKKRAREDKQIWPTIKETIKQYHHKNLQQQDRDKPINFYVFVKFVHSARSGYHMIDPSAKNLIQKLPKTL